MKMTLTMRDAQPSTDADADADANAQRPGVIAFAASRLHVLAPDGVIGREEFARLGKARGLLSAARIEAQQLREDTASALAELRLQAEADCGAYREALEQEVAAQAALQQAEWLAQLQADWMQALERCVRRLCGSTLRPDALAGAIEAGAQHFESLAGVRLGVHPDDVDTARAALARFDAGSRVRIDADPAVSVGSCRLRGRELELSFDLDRAIALAVNAAQPA